MNSIPVEYAHYHYKFLADWVFSFDYYVEDRRPDLNYEQSKDVLGYKYKIWVVVKFMGKKFSVIHKSLNPWGLSGE
jgi:hypothetical protein